MSKQEVTEKTTAEIIAEADKAIAKAEEITTSKAGSTKPLELDVRVRKVITDVFMEFKMYLGMPQEQKVYERKINEYLDRVEAILKGEVDNGRTTGTVAGI